MHYVGVAFSTGEEFEASRNRGQPFAFKLGKGQVIPGWDAGVQDMRVGGRRRLTISSAMAYGTRGRRRRDQAARAAGVRRGSPLGGLRRAVEVVSHGNASTPAASGSARERPSRRKTRDRSRPSRALVRPALVAAAVPWLEKAMR